jgi:hypothetical protein
MAKPAAKKAKPAMAKPLGQYSRNANVQFRNNNVGMFSGPRPSYQRYATSEAARDVILGTGGM